MRLSQLFTGERQIAETTNAQNIHLRGEDIARQIRALIPGQTIQGELVSRNGSDVLIRLTEDFLLNAKLNQSMNLEVGKNLTFEVKNNGRTLTLSPLFTNVATDANAVKALDMAGIPVNEETLTMTREMMKEGLSIDRNTLQNIYRENNLYPQADVKDIVYLHKLELPVNESNVNQMISYRNLSYQIEEGVQEILDHIQDTWIELFKSGQMNELETFENQLQQLLEEVPKEIPEVERNPEETELRTLSQTVVDSSFDTSEQTAKEQTDALSETTSGNVSARENMQPIQPILSDDVEEAVFREIQQPSMSEMAPSDMEENGETGTVDFSQSAKAEVFTHMKEQVVGKDLPKQFLTLLDELKLQWSIPPEDVADADKMSEFYRRMDRQLKSLAQTFDRVNQGASTGAKAVNNLTQNLDFLHQINQMYSYVQLPLRLQQGEAHGDLYVYTNKRNLSAKDGQVSALLHLDMEHLGPMDVYVVLQQENVSTKFYLRDDEMLDFINKHMDILTDRLSKRGYKCSILASVREEEKLKQGGVDKLIQNDGHIPISELAFDVRT